jgi:hypothetical protein
MRRFRKHFPKLLDKNTAGASEFDCRLSIPVEHGHIVPVAREEGRLLGDIVVAEAVGLVVDRVLVEEPGVPIARLLAIELRWIAPIGWIGQHVTVDRGAE